MKKFNVITRCKATWECETIATEEQISNIDIERQREEIKNFVISELNLDDEDVTGYNIDVEFTFKEIIEE